NLAALDLQGHVADRAQATEGLGETVCLQHTLACCDPVRHLGRHQLTLEATFSRGRWPRPFGSGVDPRPPGEPVDDLVARICDTLRDPAREPEDEQEPPGCRRRQPDVVQGHELREPDDVEGAENWSDEDTESADDGD